jgi:hypothetical protein
MKLTTRLNQVARLRKLQAPCYYDVIIKDLGYVTVTFIIISKSPNFYTTTIDVKSV